MVVALSRPAILNLVLVHSLCAAALAQLVILHRQLICSVLHDTLIHDRGTHLKVLRYLRVDAHGGTHACVES